MRTWYFHVALMALGLLAGCGGEEPKSSTPTGAAKLQSEAATPSAAPIQNGEETPSDSPDAPAASPDAEAAAAAPGLAVGERAPEFELQDQEGQTHTLAKLLESGPTALVFYRSADW